MSTTLANITSLNLSLQTGGAALAIKAVKSVAKPERTVYVFGTADDVAPNFTTVAGAITYAQSLTPIVTEPVVVRLFTKADGTPYDLTNLSSWTTYAIDYIYFVSDFVRLNVTDTLPTTLPAGQQVWYIDANGVETLWVGREDGSAWPAVGYKELELNMGTNSFTILRNQTAFVAGDFSVQDGFTNAPSLLSTTAFPPLSDALKYSAMFLPSISNNIGVGMAIVSTSDTRATYRALGASGFISVPTGRLIIRFYP
jgi:hypothetical protein